MPTYTAIANPLTGRPKICAQRLLSTSSQPDPCPHPAGRPRLASEREEDRRQCQADEAQQDECTAGQRTRAAPIRGSMRSPGVVTRASACIDCIVDRAMSGAKELL